MIKGNRRSFILFFAGIAGFISLSQEIIWVRLITFATGGTPEVFSYVLCFFLLGIACGSVSAKPIKKHFKLNYTYFLASALIISATIYYFGLPLVASIVELDLGFGLFLSYSLIFLVSAFSGSLLPILSENYIERKNQVGEEFSKVYLINIIGSTIGPLFTGFILLNYFGVSECVLILTISSLICGIFLILQKMQKYKKTMLYLLTFYIFLICGIHPFLYERFLERLNQQDGNFKYLIENRSGIISVVGSNPDTVYGGGMYDGRVNTDITRNETNIISRAYVLPAIHQKPEKVLQIGLSVGSWSKVISSSNLVKKLKIIDINSGYKELIQKYPETNSILSDPKVGLVFDDARRWLVKNPNEKFDIIVMNTTWHWRNSITNLLSKEYLEIVKNHLKKNGVYIFNNTGQPDISYTTALVFKHVGVFGGSMVVASDRLLNLSQKDKVKGMKSFVTNGEIIYNSNPLAREVMNSLIVNFELKDISHDLRAMDDMWIITDDNMVTEFKRSFHTKTNKANLSPSENKQLFNKLIFDPEKNWFDFFSKRTKQS